MNIHDFRMALDAALRPGPAKVLVPAQLAWDAIRARLTTAIDDSVAEELAFNVGQVPGRSSAAGFETSDVLQLYVGWLIDARPGLVWRTVEARMYYRYALDADAALSLPAWMAESTEVAYASGDPQQVRRRRAGFSAQVDQAGVWTYIHTAPAVAASFEIVTL